MKKSNKEKLLKEFKNIRERVRKISSRDVEEEINSIRNFVKIKT